MPHFLLKENKNKTNDDDNYPSNANKNIISSSYSRQIKNIK
jgi:hypothetical protein